MTESGVSGTDVVDDVEAEPTWYLQKGIRFGSWWVHVAAASVFVVIAFAPLVLHFRFPSLRVLAFAREWPDLAIMWAAVTALGYPIWAWLEAGAFERWVRKHPETQRKVERAYFTMHTSLAKNLWTAALAVYSAVGLLGLALNSSRP
jgi:hypothetical protein